MVKEMNVLRALHHPNIVRFHGGCLSPPHVFIVTELMHASLEARIHGVCVCVGMGGGGGRSVTHGSCPWRHSSMVMAGGTHICGRVRGGRPAFVIEARGLCSTRLLFDLGLHRAAPHAGNGGEPYGLQDVLRLARDMAAGEWVGSGSGRSWPSGQAVGRGDLLAAQSHSGHHVMSAIDGT